MQKKEKEIQLSVAGVGLEPGTLARKVSAIPTTLS